MVRITRRDFLKYCSIAAGALGLSASTMMKVEKVLANSVAPTVVWVAGSACTGCTMSLLNSVFYTTVDDVLLNRINLSYLDTAMATAGAYVNGSQWAGANALQAAQDVFNGTDPFVLVVEGALPTATPPGGSAGDYCRIGSLTAPGGPDTVVDVVAAFAAKTTCLAVLNVGTCSSFGGIPGARGNVTGAKGFAFSGTTIGGAIISNNANGSISSVQLRPGTLSAGDGYGATAAVNFTPHSVGDPGAGASATAYSDLSTVTDLDITGSPAYYTIPTVVIAPPPPGGTQAYATAVFSSITGAVTKFNVTNPGSGYAAGTAAVTVTSPGFLPWSTTANIGTGKIVKIVVDSAGSGYTVAPDVDIPGGTPLADAYAGITITKGDIKARKNLAAKVFNISGCPPHPDWIVGTISHILDTALTTPTVNANYQPVDYGYKEYQCNAGPCPWRYNNVDTAGRDYNARYPLGNSQSLGRNKYAQTDETTTSATFGQQNVGCLGILGCKGRKTKADCSRRRWNSDAEITYGVNWCVGSRAGCHGCTEPAFPDKVGKFFTFV